MRARGKSILSVQRVYELVGTPVGRNQSASQAVLAVRSAFGAPEAPAAEAVTSHVSTGLRNDGVRLPSW
jgi:hypothetical protein